MTGVEAVEDARGKRADVPKIAYGERDAKAIGKDAVVVPLLDKDRRAADVPAVVLEEKGFAPPGLADPPVPGKKLALLGDLVGKFAEFGDGFALVELVEEVVLDSV